MQSEKPVGRLAGDLLPECVGRASLFALDGREHRGREMQFMVRRKSQNRTGKN